MQGMMVAAAAGSGGVAASITIGVCIGVNSSAIGWNHAKPIYIGFGVGLMVGIAALTLTLLHYRSLIANYYNQKVNYDLHPYCTNPSYPRASTTATPTPSTATTSTSAGATSFFTVSPQLQVSPTLHQIPNTIGGTNNH